MLKKNFSLLTDDIKNYDTLLTINSILNSITGKRKQLSLTSIRQKRFLNIKVEKEFLVELSDTGFLPTLSLKQFLKLRKEDLQLTIKDLEKALKNSKSEMRKIENHEKTILHRK